MDFNFIQHVAVGKRFEDRITVTRSRSIGLPTQFFEDNKIKNYKYATLFYDKGRMAIGIQFTNDDNMPGKISITRNNQGYGGHILATSFFKANRINVKKFAGRYDYETKTLRELGMEKDGEMFIIELTEKENANEA
jgi:hypothetical protein